MKRINLKNLKVYLSLKKTDYRTDENGIDIVDKNGDKILNHIMIDDMHRQISDYIYNNMQGLNYLSLAMKLYNSDGEIELSDEETELLQSTLSGLRMNFADAVSERLQ